MLKQRTCIDMKNKEHPAVAEVLKALKGSCWHMWHQDYLCSG
jgi:hypothetical protein